MTVYFIGAGPGAPDLITVRGLNIIKAAPVCLYAGSLVPEGIVVQAEKAEVVIDTAPLHLDEIIQHIKTAHDKGQDVARVHSGDPCLYGAIGEQMRRLDDLAIDYEVVPGVSAYAAASASLKKELTLPDISQSIVLTRTAVRSSKMPNNEDLESFAKTGATLAIHLSINNLKHVVDTLTPYYGDDCAVVIAYRVSWPDEAFIHGTLANIRSKVKKSGITRTALVLVGQVLGESDFTDSKLYDVEHTHVLREKNAS